MKEEPSIDLKTLADRFIEHDDYTKDVILEELQYRQKLPDFLVLTCGDAFLIGYRDRNSLWISQVRSSEGLSVSRQTMDYVKKWAIKRGFTSITGETTRKQTRAMSKFGFKEYSVIMRIKLC